MSYQKYTNNEDDDVKIDIEDDSVQKDLYQNIPKGTTI